MIDSAVDLYKKIADWSDTQVKFFSEKQPYQTFSKFLGLETITFDGISSFFKRTSLVSKFNEEVKKKDSGVSSFMKTELGMIGSIHKSVAVRYKTRFQIYRDFVCQSGRVKAANRVSLAKLKNLKDNFES